LVAVITLALLGNCGRLCASVGRQGAAYIIAFFELAALSSTDVPFVAFVRLISSRAISLSYGKHRL
jgi:hypothetical protein